MRQPCILVFDLHETRELADGLLSILASSSRATRVRREASDDDDLCALEKLIVASRAECAPELLLIVLPTRSAVRATPLIEHARQEFSDIPIAIVVDGEEPEGILTLVKSGVDEFFVSPLRALEIVPRILRLLDQKDPEEELIDTIKSRLGLRQLVGQSASFVEQTKKIPSVAKFNTIVLILGETGTGKELFARSIHYLSPRSNKPFVPINCGAIPTELVENELFGHVRGAFTGAANSRKGLIEEAEGGTLFLDEVDCLPLLAQVKFLRFLQEKEFRPLGSTKMRQADVRVIAAANSNLEEAVKSGRLRQDLFYRLNIVPISLPPLRERSEDIPVLAQHFLRRYQLEFSKELEGFTAEAMHRLVTHSWPGNIRELEHVIERAVVLSEGPDVRLSDLVLPTVETSERQSLRQAKAKVIEKFEKGYIQGLLIAYGGNITRAAQAAQKNRRAFWQLIRRHQIDVQYFKS
jgi:DNA-binding NtrC family response regulator